MQYTETESESSEEKSDEGYEEEKDGRSNTAIMNVLYRVLNEVLQQREQITTLQRTVEAMTDCYPSAFNVMQSMNGGASNPIVEEAINSV